MRRADVDTMTCRITERLPGAVCRPLWDGSHHYVLLGQTADGRRFEVRSKADLKRILPKKRGRA